MTDERKQYLAKYCYCIDGETFHGNYDSREEAISKAEDDLIMDIANCFLEPKDYEFETAKCVYYEPKIKLWDVEGFVENISDEAYEYCGTEDYMHDLSKESLKDLTAKLNKTFEEWVKENYKRSVWYADDIEKHVMHMSDN